MAAAGIIAAVVPAFIASHHQGDSATQLSSSDVTKSIAQLQKNSTTGTPAQQASVKGVLAMAQKAQAAGRPLYSVFQNGKSVLVSQLSPSGLAKAQLSYAANPNAFKGVSKYTLQAMGLNPALSSGALPTGSTTVYNTGVTPPSTATYNAASALQQQAKVSANNAAQVKWLKSKVATAHQSGNTTLANWFQYKANQILYQGGLISTAPVKPETPSTPASLAAVAAYQQHIAALKETQSQRATALSNAKTALAAAKATYQTKSAATQKQLQEAQNNLANAQASAVTYNLNLKHQLMNNAGETAALNIQEARMSGVPLRTLAPNVAQQYAQGAITGTSVPPLNTSKIPGITYAPNGAPIISTSLKNAVNNAIGGAPTGGQITTPIVPIGVQGSNGPGGGVNNTNNNIPPVNPQKSGTPSNNNNNTHPANGTNPTGMWGQHVATAPPGYKPGSGRSTGLPKGAPVNPAGGGAVTIGHGAGTSKNLGQNPAISGQQQGGTAPPATPSTAPVTMASAALASMNTPSGQQAIQNAIQMGKDSVGVSPTVGINPIAAVAAQQQAASAAATAAAAQIASTANHLYGWQTGSKNIPPLGTGWKQHRRSLQPANAGPNVIRAMMSNRRNSIHVGGM